MFLSLDRIRSGQCQAKKVASFSHQQPLQASPTFNSQSLDEPYLLLEEICIPKLTEELELVKIFEKFIASEELCSLFARLLKLAQSVLSVAPNNQIFLEVQNRVIGHCYVLTVRQRFCDALTKVVYTVDLKAILVDKFGAFIFGIRLTYQKWETCDVPRVARSLLDDLVRVFWLRDKRYVVALSDGSGAVLAAASMLQRLWLNHKVHNRFVDRVLRHRVFSNLWCFWLQKELLSQLSDETAA
jgi:hypothetical protein